MEIWVKEVERKEYEEDFFNHCKMIEEKNEFYDGRLFVVEVESEKIEIILTSDDGWWGCLYRGVMSAPENYYEVAVRPHHSFDFSGWVPMEPGRKARILKALWSRIYLG